MTSAPIIRSIFYHTLLISLAASSTNYTILAASSTNYTILADDHGYTYMVEIEEPTLTQQDIDEITESVLKTTFLLYTQNNSQVGQQIFIDDLESIKNSYWNPERPTRLITHGWRGDTDSESAILIRDAYFSVGDYNIILIDWREVAGNWWYWKVAKSIPIMAKHVAHFLDFLIQDADLDPAKTKMIGHSLGAHLVGLAARFANKEISELLALDPAKFSFDSKGPGERVDKSDAVTVHVIHTNTAFLGIEEPIGRADFYPNGGKQQPGCSVIKISCSHSRSYKYYAESIKNPTGFRAGNVFMGGPSLDRNAYGTYYLETSSKPPFALGCSSIIFGIIIIIIICLLLYCYTTVAISRFSEINSHSELL